MMVERNHIKVFVASTIYNFEYQLKQIYELLDGFGYDVLSSHLGTIMLDSFQSNLKNCTDGIEE